MTTPIPLAEWLAQFKEHSPEPWSFGPGDDPNQTTINDTNYRRVAILPAWERRDDPEAAANEALLLAAPELLRRYRETLHAVEYSTRRVADHQEERVKVCRVLEGVGVRQLSGESLADAVARALEAARKAGADAAEADERKATVQYVRTLAKETGQDGEIDLSRAYLALASLLTRRDHRS